MTEGSPESLPLLDHISPSWYGFLHIFDTSLVIFIFTVTTGGLSRPRMLVQFYYHSRNNFRLFPERSVWSSFC